MSSLFRNDFSSRLNAENLVRKTRRDAATEIAFHGQFQPASGKLSDIYGANLRRWFSSDSYQSGSTWQDLAQQKNAYTGIGSLQPPGWSTYAINGHLAPLFISADPDGLIVGDGFNSGASAYDPNEPLVFQNEGVWGCVLKTSSTPADAVYGGIIFAQYYNGGEFLLGVTPAGLLQALTANGSAATSNVAINDGNVHTCFATWDGTTVTLYVDGVAQSTTGACPGPVVYSLGDDVSLGCGSNRSGVNAFAYYDGQMGEVFAANVMPTSAQITATQTYLAAWAGLGTVKNVTCSAAGAGSTSIAKVTHNAKAMSAAGAGSTSIAKVTHNAAAISAAGAGTTSIAKVTHNAKAMSAAGAGSTSLPFLTHIKTGVSAAGAASVSLPFLTHIKTGVSTAGAGSASISKATHNAAAITAAGAGSASLVHPVHNVFPHPVGAASVSLPFLTHIKTGVSAAGAGSASIAKATHNAAAITAAGAGSIAFSRTQHILGALTVSGAGSTSISVQKVGGVKNVSPSAAGAASVSLPYLTHIKTGVSAAGASSTTIAKVTHNAAAITAAGAGSTSIAKTTHNAAAISAAGAGATSIAKVTHNAKAASCAGAASTSLTVLRIKFSTCSAAGAGSAALVHPVHNVFPVAHGASSATVPGIIHRARAMTCAGASSATLPAFTKLSGKLSFGTCTAGVKATCGTVSPAPKARAACTFGPKARLTG